MMQDNGKYLRLFGTLFFTFIGFIVALILLMLVMKLIFAGLNFIPQVNYLYILFIICVPFLIFVPVYIVFFRRTAGHPSKGARIFSYIIFAAAFCAWAFAWMKDLMVFFKTLHTDISYYFSFNLLFLSLNVLAIFITGIVQALAVEKEKDWLEKRASGSK